MGFTCFGFFNSRKQKSPRTQDEGIVADNVRLFSYNSLRSAAGNFDPSNKIGGGGYGVVYKGVLRDGTNVAIKSLSAESKQGTKEFLTEISMISEIRHPNLVQLLGCCIEGNRRILVYEYLENNSLANALLGSKGKRIPALEEWHKRAAICLGTASGLVFLHEESDPPIVHRDIKASNILLDQNCLPKIGDFGLAKLFPDNVTHVSTRVAGTVGYLAPEYALLGQLTKKADLYSFGVVLLEIISGKSSSSKNVSEEDLVEWAWKLREEGRILELVDSDLKEYPKEEVMKFVKVALFCTQAAPNKRPSMKQVVEMLSRPGIVLNEMALTEPGIYRAHNNGSSSGSSGRNSSNRRASKRSTFLTTQVTTQGQFDDSSQYLTEVLPR